METEWTKYLATTADIEDPTVTTVIDPEALRAHIDLISGHRNVLGGYASVEQGWRAAMRFGEADAPISQTPDQPLQTILAPDKPPQKETQI